MLFYPLIVYENHVKLYAVMVKSNLTFSTPVGSLEQYRHKVYRMDLFQTISISNPVGYEEHEDDGDAPCDELCHPAAMMPWITIVPLILDTNHDESKHHKEQKVPKAYTQYCLCCKPFHARCLCECVDPWHLQQPEPSSLTRFNCKWEQQPMASARKLQIKDNSKEFAEEVWISVGSTPFLYQHFEGP